MPFHVRPVTSWNGRVAISSPEAATPTTTLTPQPLWQASSAALYRQRQDQITEVSAFPGRRRSASLETSQGEGGGAKPFFFFFFKWQQNDQTEYLVSLLLTGI